jgi:hypothetical protein
LSAVDIADERARLEGRSLVLRLPPDPFASFHYPGWTLFVVVTKPGVEVKWPAERALARLAASYVGLPG